MRKTEILSEWQFRRDNDGDWCTVRVPHDWAIDGPFDRENDVQFTRIEANGETAETAHYGRTGSLPHVGRGEYRSVLALPATAEPRCYRLEFDGVMSHAAVFINGEKAGARPYGYSSFAVDATPFLRPGESNELRVEVDNPPRSSRWYPGAGIYREARLLTLEPIHFAYQGIRLRTVAIDLARRRARLAVTAEYRGEAELRIELFGPDGDRLAVSSGEELEISDCRFWSPEEPTLYTCRISLENADCVSFRYGFRQVEFDAERGMSLNGRPWRFHGVCLHHDFGALGAAFSTAAARARLKMLKKMGCNAIRMTHNPCDPKLLDLCDELGFAVIAEAFDMWRQAKIENDYHQSFDAWHQRDLTDMLRRDRNHPSIFLWSIGNEIPEQGSEEGRRLAAELRDLCRRLDPDRPVTAGIDRPTEAIPSGFAAELDVVGWNYKPARYREFRHLLPDKPQYGSETASTVSSRGVYFLPAREGHQLHGELQCSSYDLEFPPWASTPDAEFRSQDACPWIMGEFVWTGYDYLGEPTPYDQAGPCHSSYFGLIDLAGIPKDRYFLYAARWNPVNAVPILRLLPHWNWEERAGQPVPVHVYSNAVSVELFLNGKSQGVRQRGGDFRLRWEEVSWEPGELLAIARDADGYEIARTGRSTAGPAAALRLEADRSRLGLAGDLAFVTVTVVDRDGHPAPRAANRVRFEVAGAGELAAVANGDPTSYESFRGNGIACFSGQCGVILRSGAKAGLLTVRATGDGLAGAELQLTVR